MPQYIRRPREVWALEWNGKIASMAAIHSKVRAAFGAGTVTAKTENGHLKIEYDVPQTGRHRMHIVLEGQYVRQALCPTDGVVVMNAKAFDVEWELKK